MYVLTHARCSIVYKILTLGTCDTSDLCSQGGGCLLAHVFFCTRSWGKARTGRPVFKFYWSVSAKVLKSVLWESLADRNGAMQE